MERLNLPIVAIFSRLNLTFLRTDLEYIQMKLIVVNALTQRNHPISNRAGHWR